MVMALRLSWVCYRSQGQPPGARSRAMRSANALNAAPAAVPSPSSMAGI